MKIRWVKSFELNLWLLFALACLVAKLAGFADASWGVMAGWIAFCLVMAWLVPIHAGTEVSVQDKDK